jgi:hypothetical protein
MQLADAYRILGVAAGAPEAQVRWAHDQAQLPWHGDRHAHDPEAAQYAYARRAELSLALDVIHRAGYPPPQHGALPAAVAPVDAERAHKRAQAGKNLLIGVGLLVLGAVVTAATHQAAVSNGGGTYIVAYGPIAIGVVKLFQGLFGLIAA